MKPATTGLTVIVVAETDELNELAHAAIDELGAKLRNGRAVQTQVRRFARMIISLALGTGLRLGEIVGLNVGDVFNGNGQPRVRVRIRAEIAKGGKAGDVFLPDRLVAKMRRFRTFKKQRRESLQQDALLFCNQSRTRISKRRVQFA